MQKDSKAEGIFVLGSLRKKYLTRSQVLALRRLSICSYHSRWSEEEVLNTFSEFALKKLSSLTKRVFQYSESLIQIN